MKNNKPKVILVCGLGWSGSGLLIDMLMKQKSVATFPVEMRYIKDKGGLIDLYQAMTPFKYCEVFDEFKRLVKVLARPNGIQFGMGYNLYNQGAFKRVFNDFIDTLSSKETYRSDAFVFMYQSSFLKQIYWKVNRKVFNFNRPKRVLPPARKELRQQIIECQNSIHIELAQNKRILILDQAIDPIQWSEFKWMFPNAKMIVVDRDPRDIYVDYSRSRDVLFNVKSFIENYKYMRSNIPLDSEDLIKVQFEEILQDSPAVKRKLEQFIGEELYLDITEYSGSLENIGIYKNLKDLQDDITIISEELPDALWER